MPVTAWRIVRSRYVRTAFTGIGASTFGGRWNSPGVAVVYTSQSLSLAALEMLVHLEGPDLLHRYALVGVEIDDSFIEKLDNSRLPRHWRAEPPPVELQAIGDEWAASKNSVALQVPSALVPAENNFLLNPAHADFQKLVIGDPVQFSFEQRLAL